MANLCKLVEETKIRCHGDVFHELFKFPQKLVGEKQLSAQVHDVVLHEGEWGTVGSTVSWHYVVDGKMQYGKDIIEAIDPEKKLVTFKVIEGDPMKEYKTFLITIHVDTNGDEHVVTWTLEYEKLNEDVPDPISFMEYLIKLTKDIELHHL